MFDALLRNAYLFDTALERAKDKIEERDVAAEHANDYGWLVKYRSNCPSEW